MTKTNDAIKFFIEERTLDCTSHNRQDQCILIAKNSKIPRDPAKYKCRREPMPQNDWNPLAKNAKTRLACPIGCEPDADLSVCVNFLKLDSKILKFSGDPKETNR